MTLPLDVPGPFPAPGTFQAIADTSVSAFVTLEPPTT